MKFEIYYGKKFICKAEVAEDFYSRFKGLMFERSLPKKSGLLIKFSKLAKSSTVHSLFMRFPIDLIFIDSEFRVVGLKTLHPWRFYGPKEPCPWVLELNAGVINKSGVKIGDRLKFIEIP